MTTITQFLDAIDLPDTDPTGSLFTSKQGIQIQFDQAFRNGQDPINIYVNEEQDYTVLNHVFVFNREGVQIGGEEPPVVETREEPVAEEIVPEPVGDIVVENEPLPEETEAPVAVEKPKRKRKAKTDESN